MEFACAFPSNGIPDSALRRLNGYVRGEYGSLSGARGALRERILQQREVEGTLQEENKEWS